MRPAIKWAQKNKPATRPLHQLMKADCFPLLPSGGSTLPWPVASRALIGRDAEDLSMICRFRPIPGRLSSCVFTPENTQRWFTTGTRTRRRNAWTWRRNTLRRATGTRPRGSRRRRRGCTRRRRPKVSGGGGKRACREGRFRDGLLWLPRISCHSGRVIWIFFFFLLAAKGAECGSLFCAPISVLRVSGLCHCDGCVHFYCIREFQ